MKPRQQIPVELRDLPKVEILPLVPLRFSDMIRRDFSRWGEPDPTTYRGRLGYGDPPMVGKRRKARRS